MTLTFKGPLDKSYNFLTARQKWFYFAVKATRSTLRFAVTARGHCEIQLSTLPQTACVKATLKVF